MKKQRLSSGTEQYKRRFLGTWINKCFVNQKVLQFKVLWFLARMALITFLTSLTFIALHMTETYMLLSPGVSAVIDNNRARMLGTQERVWPHLHHMALAALCCHCPTLWPWTFTLWASGFPHLYDGANSSYSPNRVVVKMKWIRWKVPGRVPGTS